MNTRVAVAFGLLSVTALATARDPVVAERPADWKPRRPILVASKPLRGPQLLVEQLSSARFIERTQATRDLARSGAAAIAPLRNAALSASPEVSIRAVAALEELWLNAQEEGDDGVSQAALTVLDELSIVGDSMQRDRVDALLSAYPAQIQKFAIDEIRRFGGSLRFDESQSVIEDDGTARPEIQFVLVGAAWQGGEEKLRHIERAAPRSVYFIRTAKLPPGAVERFAVDSGIHVETRGAGFLGVQRNQFPVQGAVGCGVEQVTPGSPAAKAGILPGDLIVQFNGKPIASFENLIEEIKRIDPGVPVETVVRRTKLDPTAPGNAQTTTVTLTVVLEEWR